MAGLMAKFRIDISSLEMITDITESPKKETVAFFDKLLEDFRTSEDQNHEECKLEDSELMSLKEKTNRHLRLREKLIEKSRDARLIVMSLPMPRKGMVSAPLYMAWLETLTRDMPPFLLIRGNQKSVLTFYS